MRPPNPRHLLLAIFGLVLLIAEQQGWLSTANQPNSGPKGSLIQETAGPNEQTILGLSKIPAGFYEVVRIEDGDTISVNMNGVEERVRLIGVDTPEIHDPRKPVQCFGQAASEFTTKLIANNPVRLEADSLSSNRDRYKRLLRYVYLPDGRLVNAEIIAQGFGFAYLSFPFEKSDEFKIYEVGAKELDRGLWGQCKTKISSKGYISTEY